MPSPFPGMDPYIESSGRWGDFHTSMLVAMRAALNERLPKGYAAEVGLYVWFEEPDERQRRKRVAPDVYVTEEGRREKKLGSAALATPPKRSRFPTVKRKRQKYLRVVDLHSNQVVTAIELLSPSNKEAGGDREAYLTKRNDCLAAGVNLVEIDLLRGGLRLPLGEPPSEVEDYYILVCRAWEYPQFDLWPVGLRDRLPAIPIPLTGDVADVELPLRSCVDQAYDGGNYLSRLPYGRPVSPRLRKRDAAWVRELLADQSPGEAV